MNKGFGPQKNPKRADKKIEIRAKLSESEQPHRPATAGAAKPPDLGTSETDKI
jgi:hypothetical protein